MVPEKTHVHTDSCLLCQAAELLALQWCSVTRAPGVSLITGGSKGHELHSSRDSLQNPWEATPPLISKVTFSHSNIKRRHIHSTQVTCWSLFQRRGSEEPDKNSSVKSGSTWRMSSVHNKECLQLWMMPLMSKLANYVRLFKVSIIIKMMQIIILIKTLSEHSQRVVFTLGSMKHVI